jgi:hypothetical protein
MQLEWAEVCDLRWDQVDFDAAILHVRRVKNGTPGTHSLRELGGPFDATMILVARPEAMAEAVRRLGLNEPDFTGHGSTSDRNLGCVDRITEGDRRRRAPGGAAGRG